MCHPTRNTVDERFGCNRGSFQRISDLLQGGDDMDLGFEEDQSRWFYVNPCVTKPSKFYSYFTNFS